MKQKRNNLFKNRYRSFLVLFTLVAIMVCLTGCREAQRVTYNLAAQADNFNILRQVTVINCIANDVVFQMTGKMSINADVADNQLEVVVENDDGSYGKHIIGLSDNVTYVVEDIDTNYMDKYKFTVNYNPKMWIPVEFEIVD